jgi:hypothetical protein
MGHTDLSTGCQMVKWNRKWENLMKHGTRCLRLRSFVCQQSALKTQRNSKGTQNLEGKSCNRILPNCNCYDLIITILAKGKVKGKAVSGAWLRTLPSGSIGIGGIAPRILNLDTTWRRVVGYQHSPTTMPSWKQPQHPLCRKVSGPQGLSWHRIQ